MSDDSLADMLRVLQNNRYQQPSMSLRIDEAGGTVELLLDTATETYAEVEWIRGERAGIGLICCRSTNRVMGIRLPLVRRNLCVYHQGPIRINSGFWKGEVP